MSSLGKRKGREQQPSGADETPERAAEWAAQRAAQRAQLLYQRGLLNESFAEAIKAFKDSPLPLDDVVQQYLGYLAELRATFAPVLEAEPAEAAPPPRMLFVVGSGDMGQLGLGEAVAEKLRPFPLEIGEDKSVTGVAAGGMHSVVLTQDGAVYSWGVNDEGPLGRVLPPDPDSAGGANQTGWQPERVDMPAGVKVAAVTAGDCHTTTLTKQGEVYAWGTFKDKNGVLGFSPAVKVQFAPAMVYSPAGAETRAVRIASGSDHVLIMLANGDVLSFGCAEIGRLGRMSAADAEVAIRDAPDAQRPALLARALTPTRVPGLPKAVSIAAGWYNSFVVAEGGAVWAFGANNYGQLGFEAKDKEAYAFYAPRRVTALDGRGVSAIASGEHHTLAVVEGGALLSFGRPTDGGLGRRGVDVYSDDAVHTPQPVPPFGPDNPVVAACAAGRVSACITAQGDMYSWGFNSTCMLGKADEEDEQLPYKLRPTRTFPAAGGVAVALGGQHALWLAQPPEDLLVAHERAEKVQRAA